MNRILLMVVLPATLVLAGCRSSQETQAKDMERSTSDERPAIPGPGVSPGHCRIVGTIVSIDPTLSSMADDPCGKAPCLAMVRIEQIMGYGSSFPTVFREGQEIRVRFRHTLGESLQPKLPGLDIGSKFQADLGMAGPVMMDEARSAEYIVESYSVR